MSKVTLDISAFKALASETRLEILRTLDGKKMSLNDVCEQLKLNKVTLHEHLEKLTEAGLVNRKEREGHKWVYYKLSWKGESLLHPENTKIVVMFSLTFVTLFLGIAGFINFLRDKTIAARSSEVLYENTPILKDTIGDGENLMLGASQISENPIFLYIAIGCFVIFTVLMILSVWRFNKNKKPKL